ncbi:MAG: arginine deiminase family protein, partial [Methanolinea sp.]|nr:arginine deiminase family protein [Methanolinea sp.]
QASLEFSGDPRTAALAREDFEKNADNLDSGHFFNILLLNPGIELARDRAAGAIRLDITEHQPLSNLYFMRDQQVVTDRGIVLSRMAKAQRARETDLTRMCWDVTGEDVVGEIRAPGTLEGGDYIPMRDFALIGVGDRTNIEGAMQLMASGMGFSEVGVVHQPADPLIPGGHGDPMIHMHLDTFFNVAGDGIAIGAEFLLKRAMVDIYRRQGSGEYRCEGRPCSLHDYLTGKGFEIIGITLLEQMAYASNILCIRDRTILSVESDHIAGLVLSNLQQKADRDPSKFGSLLARAEEDYRKLKFEGQFFPHKKEIYQQGIDAYPISLQNLTGGYGGAHCMTCTLERG